MPETDHRWSDVQQRLLTELAGLAGLAGLADDEHLVVGEPEPVGPVRVGLLARLRGRRPAAPSRYVQARRDGDWLYGECIGSTAFGGDWEVTPAQHQRVQALGWLAPGDDDPSGTQPGYPHYWQVVPRTSAAGLATAMAEALRVLGADPADLEWRRGR